MKLKQLAEAASDFYATPNLQLRKIDMKPDNAHRKKARHVCQWIAVNAGYKKTDVARFWGMNHGSVIYGCKSVANRIDTNPSEKKELEEFMVFAEEKYLHDPKKTYTK